ncbi:hypothetical protein B0H13DRAFT_2283427 [Mycena leptocephala]|nr:hypothetical protein B0H13DRAFT_2283427 [Mycena leptocephala]
MLQTPTSALSLFSFSSTGLIGLFGGFFIGAQVTLNIVLSGLSVPKTSLYATRTTEISLMPTKCVPSNGTIHLPYVAAMGYAIVIFASLFSILRAKGCGYSQALPDGHPPSPDDPIPRDSSVSNRAIPLASNRIGTGTQPPSPPPDPGSSSSSAKAPRRNPCIWVLLILVFLALVVVLGGYFIHFAYPDSPAAASVSRIVVFARHTLWAIERFFRDRWIAARRWISGVSIYIFQHSRQLSKIILLALTSLPTYCHLYICFVLISMTAIAFVPQLNWIIWMLYQIHYLRRELLSVREVTWIILHSSSYFSSLAASNFVELSMICGCVVMHTFAMGLRTLFLVVFVFPSTEWALFEILSDTKPLGLFIGLCGLTCCVLVPMLLLIVQYAHLDSNWKHTLWRSFYCQKSRDTVRATFGRFFGQLNSWKSIQIHDFHELTSGLPNTLTAVKASLEIWRTLPLIPQFLIVAPVVILYGYVYIVPAARRSQVLICIRNWLGR